MMPSGGALNSYSDVEVLPGGRVATTFQFVTGEVHAFNGAGALDASFSGDGKLSVAPLWLWANAYDSTLFVTGASQTGFEVYGLSPADGSLVADFGAGGVAKVNIDAVQVGVFATCVDSTGRLTMVGGAISSQTDYSIALARIWL